MKKDLVNLRIGNLVYDVTLQCNVTITESNIGDTQNFEPIRITSEWLEEIGFGKRLRNKTSYPIKVTNGVEFNLDTLGNYYWESDSKKLPKVKYIHQIQNIYFILTGNELL